MWFAPPLRGLYSVTYHSLRFQSGSRSKYRSFSALIFITSPVWGDSALFCPSVYRKILKSNNWTFPPKMKNSVCITFINPFKAFSLCLVSPLFADMSTNCLLFILYAPFSQTSTIFRKNPIFFKILFNFSFS